MILPPPETSSASGSPEAVVAILTLIVIGAIVYGLGKIKFINLKWLYRFVCKADYPKND